MEDSSLQIKVLPQLSLGPEWTDLSEAAGGHWDQKEMRFPPGKEDRACEL